METWVVTWEGGEGSRVSNPHIQFASFQEAADWIYDNEEVLAGKDPVITAYDAKGNHVAGSTVSVTRGNPGEIPLHESLARIANWVDYEAEVVEAAAENVDDSSIQNEAEKQADEMRDAADSLQSASEQAAETAAEIYNETHVPSTENPDPLVAGNCGGPEIVVQGNPVSESDKWRVRVTTRSGEDNKIEAFSNGFPDKESAVSFANQALRTSGTVSVTLTEVGGESKTIETGNPTTEPELEAVTAGNPHGWQGKAVRNIVPGDRIARLDENDKIIESKIVEENERLGEGRWRLTFAETGEQLETEGSLMLAIVEGNPGELPGTVKIEETELGGTIMELVPDPLEEKIEEAAASEISTDIPPEPTDWLFKNRFAHR